MSRYIDREKLKADLLELTPYALDPSFKDVVVNIDSTTLFEVLDEQPHSDVEEVRHGEWLFIIGNGKEEMWMCDQCERSIVSVRMEKDELIKRYPYCHCGAKMDGGKNDE